MEGEGSGTMIKKGVREIPVQGKRVLVRVDFNVPVDEKGQITDDTRIRAALPTIDYLRREGAKVVLVSHFGRPKGQVNLKYSLAPVAKHLEQLIKSPVRFVSDCVGAEAQSQAGLLAEGEVLLLENVRFHPEEEKNDPRFARELASLAEIFVNDAFGTAHRAHASTEGVSHYIPAVAGLLLEKETTIMGQALEAPERPFIAIIGGAKVGDKIGVIENLLKKVDTLIIGGGMANTFLKAQGYEMGRSLVEEDKIPLAKKLLDQAKDLGVELKLPVDVIVAPELKADAPARTVTVSRIGADDMALDIGPASGADFAARIGEGKTVIWNGPMGVFEMAPFASGTNRVAQAMADCGGTTIVGGGDSVAAVEKAGLAGQLTHISTGGGASLEFLEGKILPGIAALLDK